MATGSQASFWRHVSDGRNDRISRRFSARPAFGRAAVLLGAILAPTDPVLASDVQVEHPFDSDRLRFSLTGEAGWNDGTAFPFVLLGLGLLGLHEIGRSVRDGSSACSGLYRQESQ